MSRGLQKADPGLRERNNYQQGRSGSKVPMLAGPAARAARGRDQGVNATRSGGINRATRATGGGAGRS